jgi:hypothetical protein
MASAISCGGVFWLFLAKPHIFHVIINVNLVQKNFNRLKANT